MGGPGSGRRPKLLLKVQNDPAPEAVSFSPEMFMTVTAGANPALDGVPAFVVLSSAASADGIFYDTYVFTALPDSCEQGDIVWVNKPERVNLKQGYAVHIHRIPGEIIAKCNMPTRSSLVLIKLADCRKYTRHIALATDTQCIKVDYNTPVVAVTRSRRDDMLVCGTHSTVWWRWRVSADRFITEYTGSFDEPAFIILTEPEPALLEITSVCDVAEIRRFLTDVGIKIS